MVVGALAKNQAVVFAPLFLVYLVLFEQRLSVADLASSRSWRSTRAAILKGLPAIVAGVAMLAFVESMNAAAASYGGGTRLDYARTQFFSWLHYGRLFFVPVGLTADSDLALIRTWLDIRMFAGLVFVASLLCIVWVSSKTRAMRPVAFGVAWFGLALLPASSVVPLAEVVNEHRVFFPYVGLSLAVVWGVAVIAERWSMATPGLRDALPRVAVALALIVISGNAVGTYERNKVWLSEETLWRDVSEKSPANGRGLMNYGLVHMARGRYAEAKALFDRALVYTPNYTNLEINLGVVTKALGQPAAAESHFKRALELGPDYPLAHSFYAGWLLERGQADEAIGHLQRAVQLSPAILDVRHQLMSASAGAGRTTGLKALAEETLRIAPGDVGTRRYLNGRGDVVVLPPAAAPARADTAGDWLNTSLRLYREENFQGSIDAARKALDIRADYAEAYNNIAAAHASLGQWDQAIPAANQALRLKPDFPLARNNLAWAEGEKQKAFHARRP